VYPFTLENKEDTIVDGTAFPRGIEFMVWWAEITGLPVNFGCVGETEGQGEEFDCEITD